MTPTIIEGVQIRRVTIERFRGIEYLRFEPGPRTVILGPNNACKSTVLEALDLLLHPGTGRPRPNPTEIDYFRRDPSAGFDVEAIVGDLPNAFRAEVYQHLEGWKAATAELLPEPDGEGIEPVVRVRVRGTPEFELMHDFSKPESEGARFNPGLRIQIVWLFDGRARDPGWQLAFYQGGLLDRLFAGADLGPAVEALRAGLQDGAEAMNREGVVDGVLGELSEDLRRLGLFAREDLARFEVGPVSMRELLQTVRLTLAAADIQIPLARQGRGAQRLILVAVLLRLAEAAGRVLIGGFEEPEEALEPLRQAQLGHMLVDVADRGGQVFVVTHSPEIARVFQIEDFLLLQERTAGGGARHLARTLSPSVRQSYERWVDGAAVRGLFARIPVLVEGPGDRALFEVVWRSMVRGGQLHPAAQLGIDIVNCEGASNVPMLAAVLDEAGKPVVVWAEQDRPEVLREVERLRRERHCAALLLHDPTPGRQNLERAIAFGYSLMALAQGMGAIARDRGYSWEEQRTDLVSRCEGIDAETRDRLKAASSLHELLGFLEEGQARELAAGALGARAVAPFEMKGGRQARILAETLVQHEGVPENFGGALRTLQKWIEDGCPRGTEIVMNVA